MTKLALKKFQTLAITLFAKPKTNYFSTFQNQISLFSQSPHHHSPALFQPQTLIATSQLQYLRRHNTTEIARSNETGLCLVRKPLNLLFLAKPSYVGSFLAPLMYNILFVSFSRLFCPRLVSSLSPKASPKKP